MLVWGFYLFYCSCSHFLFGFLALAGASAVPTCFPAPWQARWYLPLPNLSSAFLLPPKSLQSLTLAKLLGLPLALQWEDVAFPLSQKIYAPLLLGAVSGGSFGAGLRCIPAGPCWAPRGAAMLRDGAEGAGSSHGSAAPGCMCFLKRHITGA